jgi:ATP-binding protein involved in chromosome partitioning
LPQLSGVLILTIPSQVSQLVVGRSIKIATGLLKAPVIGLVENMAAYVCTCCGAEEELFPGGHVERMAIDHGVPYLGKIPFDPRMAIASDAGIPYQINHAETPAGRAITGLAKQVRAYLDDTPPGSFRR